VEGGIGAPHDFPADLRGGLLSWIKQTGQASSDVVWWLFAQHEGCGTIDDYIAALSDRFGPGAGEAIEARMEERWRVMMAQSPDAAMSPPDVQHRVKSGRVRTHLVLLAMPDPDFRVALEYALAEAAADLDARASAVSPFDSVGMVMEYVNSLFEKRGVPYRLDRDVKLHFQGDSTVRELVIAPALAALSDPRLAGARSEFEDALTKLGAGRPKDVEDAIEESRKAVESAMKVLIDAHDLQRAERDTTEALIKILVAGDGVGGVVEPQTSDLLRAVARIANALASHGAGAVVRQVPDELAAAAVSAAATSITFLAARLP
jgi:hypothetical protein